MEKIKKVFQFILRTEDIFSIGQLLLQLGLGAGMIWLYTGLNALPSPIKALTILLIIVSVVILACSIARIVVAYRHKRLSTELYEGRKFSPHYIEDIKKAKEVWIAWHTATQAGSSGDIKREGVGSKIVRLTLLDPEGLYLPIHAPLMENIEGMI